MFLELESLKKACIFKGAPIFKSVLKVGVLQESNNIAPDCSPTLPPNEVLASVLSDRTLSSWPINEIPVVALSVKYAILHKIDIVNWFPSSHASSVSIALVTTTLWTRDCSFIINYCSMWDHLELKFLLSIPSSLQSSPGSSSF
ncbi:uncharacterized protein E5676_scaffold436G00540 [Cucumis melo var. makuwa]|uniref:Envelope-like protein n=1 Tax=Cucumis melo var. makuwa TaxID=1194695 RepID=A0A5D3DQT1_CUCMM|nr:uncharacterized protein E5676_scaffold436G00540 [Cucumis melo var. makuwa]